MTALDQYRGCMLGLAIGDALGAPVEGFKIDKIREVYGPGGVDDFRPRSSRLGDGHIFEAGAFTDDTQMSIATAQGIIDTISVGDPTPAVHVYKRYLEWQMTQTDPTQRRGPGRTCLWSLAQDKPGTLKHRINNSKGCGGVMRVAPAGLAYPPERAFILAARFTAITHGHSSGILSAAAHAMVISQVVRGGAFNDALIASLDELQRHQDYTETSNAIVRAIDLAEDDSVPVDDAIRSQGGGWTGEEALGIAVYCYMKSPDDWAKAVLMSVNHSGDSDSTGSICGALAGAVLGASAIPEKWIENVEGKDLLEELALTLFNHREDRP